MRDFFDRLNPKFVNWFNIQPPSTKADIMAKYKETGDHEDISHADKAGNYARQHRTLEFAAQKYGYDFS
jgi:hypothetical protein